MQSAGVFTKRFIYVCGRMVSNLTCCFVIVLSVVRPCFPAISKYFLRRTKAPWDFGMRANEAMILCRSPDCNSRSSRTELAPVILHTSEFNLLQALLTCLVGYLNDR